ncbi:hypothetical protein ACWQG1_005762, partial [Klebsiella pneumoniae]
MKKLPGSLEIKLHERLSKNDILNVLAEQMTMLEETFGVEEFKLYSFLECYIDSKKQALYDHVGNGIVSSLNLDSQDNIENTSKLVRKENDRRIVSFDKKLHIEKIEKTVKNLQANNKYSHCALTTSVVPASSINAIIHSENIKLQEEKHKSYLIKKQREREEEERRAKEKELYERPLKEFINKKIRESGLSEMDFKRTISSSCDYL